MGSAINSKPQSLKTGSILSGGKFKWRWEYFLIILLVLEIVIFGSINSRFLNPVVLMGSINDFMPICIISLFVTFVMITGGIDIQAGSVVGLTSISVGLLWSQLGLNIWIACLIGLLIGGLCGLFSGTLIATTDVQPMVITLGGSFLFSGIALAITSMSSVESYKGISGFPESFTKLFKGNVLGIPNQLILFILLVAISYVLLHKTQYGRKIFLIGVNRNTAEYSGIKSSSIIASTYVLSGIAAAIAGIVLTAYLGTAKADFGKELTLPIITAVVLGGTSNYGGKGNVLGTALAAVVIGIMRFGLSMSGVNTQYLDIPVGILLIVVLIIRSFINGGAIKKVVKKITNRGESL
ncbi:autoinducer 2 import system permease LsrD [Paenibacillus albiflavus]|uniref:Autoinducer 2 import system permease protein LsrD n=1 Tax=Paenibacillus albiflavus TaxID=2545760 RepID=A0A4R4DXT6_9BACL|nr:autoinducer 2 import system permease LsrD [Paenibacillus albiflavus]TCZ69936.1 autoinducer 2 import system permease LsrD [Paenibacillus albiflavus]